MKTLDALRRDYLKKLLSDDGAVAFFGELFVQAPPAQTPFSPDPYITAFECGKQNVGLWLMSELETAKPGLTAKLTKAYHDRSNALRAAAERDASAGNDEPYDPLRPGSDD